MTSAGSFQHVSAGSMSLLVHGLFVTFLLFGVSWRSLPHLPVEAELWSALPEPPAPLPALPEPASLAPPEPAQPAAAKPDIALERAEKKRREQEAHQQEALRLKEEARQELSRRRAEEAARVEKDKQEKQEKLHQEQVHREQTRREMEQELARQAQDELDAEETQLRGALQKHQAKAGRQARLVGEFQDRIRSKILAYLRLPQNLSGNPEVVFNVTLLPNGEVVRAVLVRGSGQPAYDQEMERAILKASPLPLPNERDVAAVFRDGLILKFRPRGE
jgi:colicin import membrane protein